MINQLWYAPAIITTEQINMEAMIIFLLLLILALLFWILEVKRQNRRDKKTHLTLKKSNIELHKLNTNLSQQAIQDADRILENEQKFTSLVAGLYDEFFFYQHDPEGFFNYVSPSITHILGYSVKEFSQHYTTYLTEHPDNALIHEYTSRTLKGENMPVYPVEILDSHGNIHTLEVQESPVYNNQGKCIGLNGIAHDITQIQQTREQLNLLSYYDDLTGLANQRLFSDRVEHMVSLSRRQHKSMALLFLDLDGFKLVNESFGHTAGNAALQEVAKRLKALLRHSDTAARTGGDEFALILFDTGARAARTVAKKLLKKILRPYSINKHQFRIGCSIGIAIYPQDGSECATLLDKADRAMYFAKQENKPYAFCSPELDEQSLRQLKLEQDLRIALTENNDACSPELSISYQSKHDTQNNHIQGYEALIHWQHPELGQVSPDEIIPIAEHSGLITELTRWVVTQVGLQGAEWAKKGVLFNKIAFNISAIEIINFELASNIIKLIDETGALRKWIEIEITENTVMTIPDVSLNFMEQLVNAGVSVTIDHFSGQTSPGFLKKTPANCLKIAPALIQNILTSPEDQAIVKSLILTAHKLNKKVIVVAVETEEQLAFLKDIEADIVQGYLFSKPCTAEQVELYVSELFSIKEG